MSSDTRLEALSDWVCEKLGTPALQLGPVSNDASFRRYFRVRTVGGSLIAMDAPPEQENSGPFVHVAGLLREAGLNAPEIIHQDLQRGFLLLTDLGTQSYLDVINEDNADALFDDAIDALIRWQLATRAGELPPYERSLLQAELDLFPDWYVARHLDLEMTSGEREVWCSVCETLIRSAREQPQVYVHRDYMPRNLMIVVPTLSESGPGVIDFQDAVLGPISYDVVSLFRDAFISWDEARIDEWAARYWSKARASGLPVHELRSDFMRAFNLMGIQRHLKVLGIFARLNYRDGKPHYLADTPRFLDYVTDIARRHPTLEPLLELLNTLLTRNPRQ